MPGAAHLTFYHLARWRWDTSNPAAPFWDAPQAGAIGCLDMRAHDECAVAGGAGGFGIFAYASDIGDGSTIFTLASDPQELIGAARRTLLQNTFGATLSSPRFVGILAELFLDPANIDVTGATKRRPIMPTNRKRLEIHLAGLIRDSGIDVGDAVWPVIRAQYRSDFRKIRLAAQIGDKLPGKVLGYWLKRWNVSDPTEFQTPGDPVVDPIEPATTIADDFTRADADALGSSSESWSWTEVQGDIDIVSNAARAGNTVLADKLARAESDLSSADHYGQVSVATCTSGATNVVGAAARFASAATTCYVGWYLGSGTLILISKIVTGTRTNLGNTAITFSLPEACKIECNGTTIKVYQAGTQRVSVTDSSITTGTRGGMFTIMENSGQAVVDDFSAADLAAAAATGYLNLPLLGVG